MSGGGDQESSTTFQLAPEQRQILKLAMPFLQDVKKNPPQPPSGTAIAPFNPTQETAQAGALGMTPFLADYAANAWDGNQFLSGGDVLGSTPFNSQLNKIGTGQMGGNNPAFNTLRRVDSQSMPGAVQNFYHNMRLGGGGTSPGVQTLNNMGSTSLGTADFFRMLQQTGGGQGPTGALSPWSQGQMFGQTGTEDFLRQLTGGRFTSPAQQGLSPLASGEGTRNPVLDMLGMFTSGDLMDVNKNPALKNAIDAATRPIVENTMRQALPGVRQDFIGAGQYGGTKQGLAEAQAINEMQKNVGDTSSLMANRAYETGMQGTLQGLGLYSDAFRGGIGQQLEALGLQDSAFGRDMGNRIQGAGMQQDAYTRDINAMLQAMGMQDTAFARQMQNRITGGQQQYQARAQDIQNLIAQAGLQDTAFGRQLEARFQGAGQLDAAAARDVENMLTKAGLQDTAFGRRMSSMLEAAGLKQQAYGQELESMTRGLGLAPQTASLGLLPWQVMSAVGDTQHGMDMARQQEAYNQQELANMWNLMLGQELAGTVGLIPGGTNISTTPAPQMNPFSMALGGLGLVSGLGPLMGLF